MQIESRTPEDDDMKRLKVLAVTIPEGLLMSLAAQAAPPLDGSQRIFSEDESCELAVPADWKVEKLDRSTEDAPDGSAKPAGLAKQITLSIKPAL
jgi:hypothetical protein